MAKPTPALSGKIWSLPTGPQSIHKPTLVLEGPLEKLRPFYAQAVGKNPDRANVGYLLIADSGSPLECANTFAV